MTVFLKPRLQSLDARAKALAERKLRIDTEIDSELGRPLPCHLQLGRLKRTRLRVKDDLTSIHGVLATLARGQVERRVS